MLVSLVLVELAALAVVLYPRQRGGRVASGTTASPAVPAAGDDDDSAAARDTAIGGSAWSGFARLLRSPYLRGLSGYLALYTVGSTFLYFATADIVGATYSDRAERTRVLALIDFSAQAVTAVVQATLTGRIIRWIGIAGALAVVPAVTLVGFAILGAAPVFTTLAVFAVLRRATNFSVGNPAMEALYTVVPREDKYRAKSLIETFVYRAGDQLSAWLYAGLAWLGLGLTGISIFTIPVSAGWALLALWLGRESTIRKHSGGLPTENRPGK
jgi:AAA family ATP:ADP antiporter